jgi:hypothetical protein
MKCDVLHHNHYYSKAQTEVADGYDLLGKAEILWIAVLVDNTNVYAEGVCRKYVTIGSKIILNGVHYHSFLKAQCVSTLLSNNIIN